MWELRQLSEPPDQLCHARHICDHGWIRAMHSRCSSQPEHDRLYLCTHLQLLHLPLKHLLPEFMKDTTRIPGWIRAGAAFLFLNFNNFLAAVSKLFYRQSHFPCHSSTSVCPSGLASPSAETSALWPHVLPTFPFSASASSLHSYLTSLPSPRLSICSLPPSFSGTSALQMLLRFLHVCLLEVPRFPPQTLLLLHFHSPSRIPFAPVPHPSVRPPKPSNSALASRYVTSDKTCSWRGSDFKRWRSPCQGKLGFS